MNLITILVLVTVLLMLICMPEFAPTGASLKIAALH